MTVMLSAEASLQELMISSSSITASLELTAPVWMMYTSWHLTWSRSWTLVSWLANFSSSILQDLTPTFLAIRSVSSGWEEPPITFMVDLLTVLLNLDMMITSQYYVVKWLLLYSADSVVEMWETGFTCLHETLTDRPASTRSANIKRMEKDDLNK